jgi:hypothetical protein
MTAPTPRPPTDDERVVDWGAVARGAVVGLAILAATSIVDAILDHHVTDYPNSGWRAVLFVVILLGYFAAGVVAGWFAPYGELTNGALAALGSVVLWLPLRVAIWLVRDTGAGLFHGSRAALAPGQVFGALVISAGLGMLGGWFGARRAARARPPTS